MMQGKIGYDSGGYVAFELVEPVARYGGCQKGAVSEYPVPAHREVVLVFVACVLHPVSGTARFGSISSDFRTSPLI